MRNADMEASPKPCVVVYRDHILPASETFIDAQTAACARYAPVLAGSRRVSGLTPRVPVEVVDRGGPLGRAREVLYKGTGIAPGLVRALRRRRPALLHAHFGRDAAVALPLIHRLGVPFLVTYHGYDATVRADALPSSYPDRLYRRRRARLVAEAAVSIAVSRFIAQRLEDGGWDASRIRVHYIGVDTEFFTPRDLPREPVVLFVGRLVEKKGGRHLIGAMARLRARRPEARLVVIGDGPLLGELRTLAGECRVSAEFLGVQPREAVRDWMARARVFCVPSVVASSGDAEGFGMVFAEAQAMGLPVVAFASGGVPEAVASGETGLLYREGDVDGLTEGLETMLGDEARWRRFSEAGVARIRTGFDVRRQTAALEDIYDQVVASAAGAHR
jgi:colanic acid/amylovoran biosynthesis glycosyltransferase